MTTRRDFIAGGVAGVALASSSASSVLAAPKPKAAAAPAPIKPGEHKLVELPFKPEALKGLSAAMLTSHHANNYTGAVKNLNKVELELAKIDKDTPGFQVAALRERELTFTNSKILHECYFGNLGGDGKLTGAIDKRLATQFGSTARWEELFRATAMSLGGGSGWVILDANYATGDLRIYGSGGHSQALAFGQPLLVLDMYEHAYAIDYGAGHAKYIDAFFQNVRWSEVERRLARSDKAQQALRG
ncbi:MAG: superoxide dismutase [Deltaproteobacteria bacterium]|nr:superoxide dismutase [Deltaproteobacteria bacterium]MDQ3301593.1 superoxide dismutase [Myxococcota bacterium]